MNIEFEKAREVFRGKQVRASEVDPVEYDKAIYSMLVLGIFAGTKDMIDDDMVIGLNPESRFFVPEQEETLEEGRITVVHGAQSQYLFPGPRIEGVQI